MPISVSFTLFLSRGIFSATSTMLLAIKSSPERCDHEPPMDDDVDQHDDRESSSPSKRPIIPSSRFFSCYRGPSMAATLRSRRPAATLWACYQAYTGALGTIGL